MDENLPSESIVPIAVVLDERTGYTLWAPPWEEDDEEWQAFLGTGGKVHLFTSPAQLAHFLTTDAEHDLSDHPSWSAVRRVGRRELRPDLDYRFDLDGLYDLVAGGPDRWSVGELADTVDMVERIGECCEVEEIEDELAKIPGLGLLDSGSEVFASRAGEKAWSEIAAGLGQRWEAVLEALGGALHWVEPVELDEDEDEDDEDDDDDNTHLDDEDDDVDDVVGATALHHGKLVGVDDDDEQARAAAEFWESVGILPVRLVFAEAAGLTLRCYVEDSARFLGRELTPDVFRSAEGLSAFVEQGEPHDLTALSTWGAVVEADAEPIPAEQDTYDFDAVSQMLDATGGDWDLTRLARAAEGALDLAEYCHLERVVDLLTGSGELALALDEGDAELERPRPEGPELAVLAEQWSEVVAEITTCLRWRD